MTSIPRLLHEHSFFDTMDTGPEDKGGGSKFHKMQLKMAVVQIKLLRNKKQAVVKQMRGDIALPLQSGHDIREKYGKDFVYTAIDVHPGCGANRMLWCEIGHMQFVDSASAAEVAANSASDTMAAAQVAAYLANKDSNQSDELKLKFDEGSTMSKLWIMNLGGSECLGKAEVQGENLKESQNINKSLPTFGDVISALSRITTLNRFRHVDEEKTKAISLFEKVMDLNDAIEDEVKWVEDLIRGIIAGNIFDLGFAQLAEVFSNEGMSFFVSCQNLVPRPWVIDDLDVAMGVCV
ncbi:hypothetical protein FF1_012111 [Malus domestica]